MQVHRFRDKVAVAIDGDTVYLDPTVARKLARAMNACAKNIKDQPVFHESDFQTVTIDGTLDALRREH